MKNFIQDGNTVTLTAPYETLSGAGCLVVGVFGIATGDVANGATGQYAVEGVFEINKLATDTIDQGQVVYWDNTNKRITETKTSNYKVGTAIVAAGNGVSTVKVKLDGVGIIVEAGA